MGTTYATRALFCEQLFDDGRSTVELRLAYLKPLRESVLQAQNSGSAVLSTAKNGAAVQFQFFDGWAPSDAANLIHEAYSWARSSSLDAALALIHRGASFVLADFSQANATGGTL